ncbi:hypothetical protein KBB96_10380 [Luteolibacter ambystomatis]|uniref:DUF995 domain-containing protein n=1 Tax=Luteolibacter ambystomatis TaxID=2824561 RepID=A0A975G5D2_9BACT|nr:hypothetical protein [Luteolibacter ambystomatis]QUE49278.1 hypothetical protein KBB96_10380 [Luteolibacter ambystomatis]
MRRYLALGLIGISSLAIAAPEPVELATLRTAYAQKLEALIKSETAKGNIDGAVLVRDELAKVRSGGTVEPAGAKTGVVVSAVIAMEKSPFYGSFWQKNDSTLEFHKDGTWKHDYKGSVMTGKWETTGDARLISLTNWNNNPDLVFVLSKDGSVCRRSADGYSYNRQPGAGSPAATAPAGGGSSNPFGNVR